MVVFARSSFCNGSFAFAAIIVCPTLSVASFTIVDEVDTVASAVAPVPLSQSSRRLLEAALKAINVFFLGSRTFRPTVCEMESSAFAFDRLAADAGILARSFFVRVFLFLVLVLVLALTLAFLFALKFVCPVRVRPPSVGGFFRLSSLTMVADTVLFSSFIFFLFVALPVVELGKFRKPLNFSRIAFAKLVNGTKTSVSLLGLLFGFIFDSSRIAHRSLLTIEKITKNTSCTYLLLLFAARSTLFRFTGACVFVVVVIVVVVFQITLEITRIGREINKLSNRYEYLTSSTYLYLPTS